MARDARPRFPSTGLPRLAVVLGVGYVRSPVGLRLLTVAYACGDGEVGHEVVGRGAVPVLLVVGCVDDIAGADLDGVAAAGLYEPGSFGDVEGLAEGVGVPGAAGPGAEADCVDADARGLFALGDGVDPYVAGECLGRSFGGGLLGLDLHLLLLRVGVWRWDLGHGRTRTLGAWRRAWSGCCRAKRPTGVAP